ncbi:MAG: hypothetical protein WC381_11440 [Kiritimatiellia bacterium]|jgi:hypothetical protein
MSTMRTDLPEIHVQQPILPGCTIPNISPALKEGRFRFPETVFVIASGPNGRGCMDKIPHQALTIALNSSITIPRKFTWWLAFDHKNVAYRFWETINLPETRKMFSARLVNHITLQPKVRKITPDWFFTYQPNLVCPTKLHPKWETTPKGGCLIPYVLRGGATVSGIAIQWAHYAGAKNVVLVGCDMTGRGHFDSYINPDPYDLCAGVWPWAGVLQNLCDAVAERGTRVWTLSDTALDLPRWEE